MWEYYFSPKEWTRSNKHGVCLIIVLYGSDYNYVDRKSGRAKRKPRSSVGCLPDLRTQDGRKPCSMSFIQWSHWWTLLSQTKQSLDGSIKSAGIWVRRNTTVANVSNVVGGVVGEIRDAWSLYIKEIRRWWSFLESVWLMNTFSPIFPLFWVLNTWNRGIFPQVFGLCAIFLSLHGLRCFHSYHKICAFRQRW